MTRINELFGSKLAVVNVGAENFKTELAAQGSEVVQVDWRPPAGGNPALIRLLIKLLKRKKLMQQIKQ